MNSENPKKNPNMNQKYWKTKTQEIKKNKNNINPIIEQTYEDKKNHLPNKNFQENYSDCTKGSLYLNQYAKNDQISIDEMAMLICREKACELNYCQSSFFDPYEKPFKNCDEFYNKYLGCTSQEIRRYLHDSENRNMNQQIEFMLEKKRKQKEIEKIKDLSENKNTRKDLKFDGNIREINDLMI